MIGILNAYHFDFSAGSYQERYNQDVHDFLARTFPGEHVRHYKIAGGEWPLSYDECRVWVITGSAKGAYEDVDWIARLQNWIREANARKKKLVGICFGHQLIAQALGGKVEKSPKGWGVGVKPFQVFRPQAWMKPPQARLELIFSHQDQVVELPAGADLLAQDEFCPNQMFQIGTHILTMQGHPEFSVEFAIGRLNARKDLVGRELYDQAVASLSRPRDDKTLALWIREFAKI